jgi:16S rRNA (guanine527-N7)-methyltransferase
MDIFRKYFKNLSATQIKQFEKLQDLYEVWNLKINGVSRKDIDEV